MPSFPGSPTSCSAPVFFSLHLRPQPFRLAALLGPFPPAVPSIAGLLHERSSPRPTFLLPLSLQGSSCFPPRMGPGVPPLKTSLDNEGGGVGPRNPIRASDWNMASSSLLLSTHGRWFAPPLGTRTEEKGLRIYPMLVKYVLKTPSELRKYPEKHRHLAWETLSGVGSKPDAKHIIQSTILSGHRPPILSKSGFPPTQIELQSQVALYNSKLCMASTIGLMLFTC